MVADHLSMIREVDVGFKMKRKLKLKVDLSSKCHYHISKLIYAIRDDGISILWPLLREPMCGGSRSRRLEENGLGA